MSFTRSGASYNPSRSSQKGHRCDYFRSQSVTEGQGSVDDLQINKLCHSEAHNTILPSKRAETTPRSLSGHLQSQPEGLQQGIAAQRVPDPFRSVEKMHELLPDFEKIPGPFQHLQVTQWMASIDGKEEHDAFNNKGKRKAPATKPYIQGYRIPKIQQDGMENVFQMAKNNDEITEKGGGQIHISEMISDIFDSIPEFYEAIKDVKTHFSDKKSSICNNVKINNLILSQINETLMFFEKVLREIKTSNNANSFGNKLNEKSAIIKELTDKYSQFNIDEIIEKRIKQAIHNIKEENKIVLENISKSSTEVKTYTIALKKCFDTSKEEISKLTMKFNQITLDNTRETELWQESTQTEYNLKTDVISSIQILQHEFRNSQRCKNSKINHIEQLIHTLPRIPTPLNQNEGTGIPNPQLLEVENSQLKHEFSTSFHNMELSMGQALLKELSKLKERSHFSGEGEYDYMEFMRGIDIIKEDF
ncbi:hypothetical protein O181_042272 [Austropuccinia psidii MF-1]|uniref:Uncharacterized protein n=1 Tax=Austropuccinia psidii MF-1 TaxID=1389203 RepID=A0A9Q3HFQ3_9BASI|nr:hypothetical protein [Austropuccinia psidii MF-1]